MSITLRKSGILIVIALLSLCCFLPSMAYAQTAPGGSGSGVAEPQMTTGKKTAHPAEGGTWTYGNYGDQKIHSDYLHSSKAHGTSCQLDNETARSIDTAKGYTAKCYIYCWVDMPWTYDAYWYRIC